MKRISQTPRASYLLLIATVSAISACREAPPTTQPFKPPNVLLVTIETFRADHAGVYGYPRNTTPNLDLLARRGAVFMQAIAQAPFTLPSLASILTGRTPPAHGVRNHPATLRPEITTLAEHLALAGYQTAAMTRHSWLRRRSGFDQGFNEYHVNKFSAGLDARSLSLAATDWLGRAGSKPFFLWVHFIDPHLPYTPSYPYSVLYHPDYQEDSKVKDLQSMIDRSREDFAPTPYADLSGGPYLDLVLPHYPKNPVLLDLAFRQRPRVEIFFGKARYPKPMVDQVRDLYDGTLVYTDDNLARLLRALSELGLEENTVVAVAGDHGEALGDHGLYFTHDFTLYDETLRVPFVISWPGRIPAGTVVSQQVRLMDIAPTLLELAGLTSPPDMEGVSLVPLLTRRSLPFLPALAESAPRRPLFSGQPRAYYEGNKGKWRMVRVERWKLILIPRPGGDIFELYDLVSDPGETRNLYDELPGEAGKLWPVLQEWLRKDPDRELDRTAEETQALEEIDPATRQQLEVLGYIH